MTDPDKAKLAKETYQKPHRLKCIHCKSYKDYSGWCKVRKTVVDPSGTCKVWEQA